MIIASVLLASALSSAPPPPTFGTTRYEAVCVDGKLVAFSIESPGPGWLTFEIPANVCAPPPPKSPPRRAKPST